MTNEDAASKLIASLEALVAISEVQGTELAQAREDANQAEEMFESQLERRIEGLPRQSSFPLTDMTGGLSRIQNQQIRQVQRETSFLDAFQALMPLWSDGATRERAENVYHLLRSIRLMDVGDDTTQFATEMPPFSPPTQMESLEEGRRGMLRSMLDHHHRMRDFMRKHQDEMNKRIEKSEALLREALTVARTMVD